MAIKIKVVNMVPKSLSNEASNDREPNLTVNPVNPQQIVGTAFTPDPAGSSNAPIYVSNDGGETWSLNAIVIGSTPGSSIGTADITSHFSSKALYVGDIRVSDFKVEFARTLDPFSPLPMTSLQTKGPPLADQPYVEAVTVSLGPDAGKDRVFVGNNDFAVFPGKTATVDRSLDAMGGGAFTSLRIETRSTGTANQDGPSIRTATHQDGTVYAAFFGWRARAGSTFTTDVVVVRDDSWTTGPNPFTALLDPGDSLAGLRVVTGRTVIFNQLLGQQRTGSQLTIAVDPNNSSTVYIAWCDVQAGGYTLHVRRSTDRGVNWSATDLLMVEKTTNPSLAINQAGKIGLLYQQLAGIGANQRWETHFRLSKDGLTWDDYVLANTPSNQPIAFNYIGDYAGLTAVGTDFFGIFSSNNTPDLANFPQGVKYQRDADFTTHTLHGLGGTTTVAVSIDPFFFKVAEEDEDVPSDEPKEECCKVELPDIPAECVSPAAPPWLPFSQCIVWYETRYVRSGRILYRIIYEHDLCMVGRQQGPLLFTMTLLPGESLKLYHYDRYRRTKSTTDLYSVHTSFRQSVSAVHRSRVSQSTSKYEEFLNDVRASGDTNVTVGGELFPVSWNTDDFDSNTLHLFQSASAQSASEEFSETATTASQQVDAERSIVVSTFEDAEAINVTSREIKNPNDCRAVTYFVRRVNEVYKMSTKVVSVSWTVPQQKRQTGFLSAFFYSNQSTVGLQVPFRSIEDLQGVDGEILRQIRADLLLLPKIGEVAEGPRPITLGTDGVLYEAELAHCSSCEPERVVAERIALEKAKAEALKACCEAELCRLEARRRRLLLDKGDLSGF
jgi:hypothetical protein